MSDTHDHTVPRHLGLILDGNRRWAQAQGLPTLEGHKKGYENLKTIAKAAFESGVTYISAYVFSTENWKRSVEEVDYLMKMLIWVATNEISELDKQNIRVRFIGEREQLSAKVIKAIDKAQEKTKDNDGGTLLLCLNYGGQQEIASAVTKLLIQNPGKTDITPEDIAAHLYEPTIPPVDLIIRTSGEQRISNFMLWRAAYSELCFVDSHWPAFTTDDLKTALKTYSERSRRFGK